MDQIATPELCWTKGYAGQPIKFIDSKTLACVCGNTITFTKEGNRDIIFTGPNEGIGPFDVHAINKHFAFSGQNVGPKIKVYDFPSLQEVTTLEGGAVLEYLEIAFSASEYLITLSGVPDYKLTVWNYLSGEPLCSSECAHVSPTSMCVNPGNWRQMCIATEKNLSLWTVEQSNTEYLQQERHMTLSLQPTPLKPSGNIEDDLQSAGGGRNKPATSRLLQVTIPLPKSAIAGLVDENSVTRFEDMNDGMPKASPVSLAWTPSGDIIVGCAGGELLSVNSEVRETRVLFAPVQAAAEGGSKFGPRGTLLEKNMSIMEEGEEQETENEGAQDSTDRLGPGSADCLGLHKKGLYVCGKDGHLRLLDISNNSVKLLSSMKVGGPVCALSFSSNYKQMALGTSQGSIHLHNVDQPGLITKLLETDRGAVVGLGPISPGSEYAVSLRSEGQLQCWHLETGDCVSTISANSACMTLASSPLCPMVIVGSAAGYMLVYDYANVKAPRLIFTNRLYDHPLRTATFDRYGNYLFAAGSENNVMIVSGKASEGFKPLGYVEVEGSVQTISTYTGEKPYPINVAVTCRTKDDAAGGSSKCVTFTITEEVMQSVESHYASLKADMSPESINKIVFNFTPLSHGASLGGPDFIFSLCQDTKYLQKMYIPAEKPKKPNSKDSFLVAEEEYDCHQLPGGLTFLSPHQKWLATVGPDGRLCVRTVGALDKQVVAQPSDYRRGGITTMAWSGTCQHILTAGGAEDGILTCYKWQCMPGGDSKLKAAAQASKSFTQSLSAAMEAEVAQMYKMSELKLTRRSSLVEGSSSRDVLLEKAILNDEIFSTPAPTPKADATWIQARKQLSITEEDKQFTTAKKSLRTDLREIRRTLQGLIKQNEVVADIEKLSHHEFDLDIDEQHRLQAKGEAEVARIREEIEFENLAKIYLRELIKEECWDNMVTKGRCIKGFGQPITVSNFPMKKRSGTEMSLLQKVMIQRKIEMDDLKTRRELTEARHGAAGTAEEGGEEEDVDTTDNPAITGSMGNSFGGKSKLFYNQFELHTRDQKTKQAILLQDAIYRIKESFNKEFDEVMQKKEQELSKINERNKRLRKIFTELNIDETVETPVLSPSEKPESLLTVEDSEVTVERYLSPEQLKAQEAIAAVEAERLEKEKGDNARERALDMMMGGVLEVKKEDELKIDIPVPTFLSKSQDDWSEDEKKAAVEYERKVKELEEEREKYRKQLETELKKLQQQLIESEQAFNEALRQLFSRKLSTDMVVYQEELKIHRIQHSLLFEESLDTRARQIRHMLNHKKALRAITAEAVAHAKANTDAFRDQYDILVAEDKVMDKSFKRDFSDVSPFVSDQLYKLFRRRPRQQRGFLNRGSTPMFDPSSGNPFADRPSTAVQREGMAQSITEAVQELNKDTNMPEGCEIEQWQRMCEQRANKIASEQLVKQKALVMADMIAFQQKRLEEEGSLGKEIDELQDELSRLDEDKNRYKLNLEVQLLMKQGQVEINPGPFIHDYSTGILVHRSSVEDLNTEIKELGEKKIKSMEESKDFRKGIIQLEWEHKKNLMKVDDLKNKMRDINMIKVTREIQAFLNESDHDAKIAQEVAILEQTILVQKKHHDANVADKKKILGDLRHTAKDREFENRSLMRDIEELNVSVNERQQLDQVSTDQNMEAQRRKRYQEIVQRRKLVDLAKAQANEVAVLRAEVERLRMRTFPALVQVER